MLIRKLSHFFPLKSLKGGSRSLLQFSTFNNYEHITQDLYDNCNPEMREHIAMHQDLSLAVIDRLSEMEISQYNSLSFMNKKDKRAKYKRRSRKHGQMKRPKFHQK